MSAIQNNYPVVCFGEILWDVLPAGAVPGGAPMNVAYHLKKMGINPALISRVGKDDPGLRLMEIMNENFITTDFFQLDDALRTGKVIATPAENNEVEYNIIQPVAWDNIELTDKLETLVLNTKYFIHGSLIARNEISCKTLFSLRELASIKVFDINLRPPHYNRPVIEHLLKNVQLLKLNKTEAALITGWFGDYSDENDQIQMLQNRFNIQNIMLTRGANGSVLNINGKFFEHPGYKVTVADTVGSGDASLAALIAKLIEGEKFFDALSFSSALGALVATRHGACPAYDLKELMRIIHDGL